MSESRSRPGLAAAVVLPFASLVGGFFGVVVAAAALHRARRDPHAPAFAAAGCAIAAALSSLVPWPGASSLSIDFADRRGMAAGFGLATAVLLAVAAVGAAVMDRAPDPPRAAAPRRLRLGPRQLGDAAVVGGATLLALAVRAAVAPTALPPGYAHLADSIVGGWGFSMAPSAGVPTAFHPPLAAIAAALAPGAEQWTLVIVSALAAGACSLLALRLGGPVAGVIAGCIAAFAPSFWGQQLPESLAMLAVLAVLVLARPTAWTGRRAGAAGVVAGFGVLARPEVLVVLLVVVAWVMLTPGARRRLLLTFAAGFAVIYTPWQMHVERTFDVARPSLNLGATVAGANTPAARHGDLRGSWDLRGVFDPALAPPEAASPDEAERDRALLRAGLDHASWSSALTLVPARVLRGWELWSPSSAQRAREGRGLPYSGGVGGGVAEGILSGVGLAGLVALRRRWRSLLPVFALPALFTIESALLFGDRGLRSWAAPMTAVSIALVGAQLLRRRRPPAVRRRHLRKAPGPGLARESMVVFGATSLTNLAAYGYHVLLSRSLGPGRYGTLGALLALGIVASVPAAGLQYAVARRVAVDPGAEGMAGARGAATLAGGAATVALLAVVGASPLIGRFLHADVGAVLWFGVWLVPLALSPVLLGYLQGRRRFWLLSAAVISVGIVRVGSAAVVRWGGFGVAGGVAAMALASMASVLVALPACRGVLRVSRPPRGLGAEIGANTLPFVALSVVAALDVVLARHYLDATQAGYYAAAAIAGKIVLWAPAALAIVAFPEFATGPPGGAVLRRTMVLAGSVCLVALVSIELLKRPLIGGLFGSEFLPSTGVLALVALAMTCLALVQVQVTWAIGRRLHRITPAIGGGAVLLAGLLVAFHGSPKAIAGDLLVTCAALLAVTTLVVRDALRREVAT